MLLSMRRCLFLSITVALVICFTQTSWPRALAQRIAEQPTVARVTVKDKEELERILALGLDLLEMRQGDDLFILTTPEEITRLVREGLNVTVDQQQTDLLRGGAGETFSGGYRTVTEMRAFVDTCAARFPLLAEVFVYGSSWQKITSGGVAGHDLFGIKLTNRSRPGPKPTFFLMAAIHARELTTSELALRFIDYLLNGYGTDGDATWLLDEHLIVVVPVVNPDGRRLAEQSYSQRKNLNDSYGGNCSNPPSPTDQYGVDLNRNYDFKWGTINSPATPLCSQTYPGPSPASEPETASVQNLVRSLFADQRGPSDTDPAPPDTTGVFLTLHSYSNLVLWPWGWTGELAPNAQTLSLIGRKLASYNGFTPQQSIALYPTSGTTDDWGYGELGIPAMTFEVGPTTGSCGGFFPPLSCLDGGSGGSFWPRNLPAFLYAARIARAPYLLAQGPTPESATAMAVAGNQIELRAQFDEQFNGGQSIAAAEYYIDTPPWQGGIAHPMSPADGSFNSTNESATATIGSLVGRRLLYVRALDASGRWGPVRAVFSPCAGSISQASQAFPPAGGQGSVELATSAGCGWSVASNSAWIAVTSQASGSGSAQVTFDVAPNLGEKYRTGTLAIAGNAFTVEQAGAGAGQCRNMVYPASKSFPVAGGTGSISVGATAECYWTAASNAAWVMITQGSTGLGSGTVLYSVGANTTGASRTATITVAGKVFTVKQKGS
jgi:zinc carboxypeptidase/all-beta uncharacterized protein/BACON domain-containing protein